MALRFSEDDPSLNPSHNDYEDKFNGLKNAEQAGNINPDTANTDNFDAKAAEENPGSNWQNNVTGAAPKTSKLSGRLGFLKKKGPLSLIITIVIGGGLGFSTFFSPGILIVQLKEMMVEKFNMQLASMDVRSTKILATKMGSTKGVCSKVVNIACKYSSMSSAQVANFEKAGIKVNTKKTSILGRSIPESFEFKGNEISAKNFVKEIETNAEFRSAIKLGYNPKYAGFTDKIWQKVASTLKISKAKANLDGDTDEEKLKKVQDSTKEGLSDDKPSKVTIDDTNPETGEKYTQAEADEINNKRLGLADDLAEAAEEIADEGEKVGTKVLNATEKTVSTVGNVVKITGFADSACTVYRSVQSVGYAAKTVRAAQLARYAMLFLNVADQIKAGVAKPDDVSYLGKILTSEVATIDNKKTKIKSATDSFGYKYAAFGDIGKMPNTTTQFLAGGGLTGDMIGITSKVNSTLGGTPKTTCKILGNPLVSAGSLLAGVALFLVPGVNVAIGIKDIAQGAAAAAFSLAAAALPAMLQDIVAGVLVDDSTVGELAGDAITSGSSGLMSKVAAAGGNAPLTPEQAVAYNNLSEKIALQYAEEDRLAYSPFDITNRNTFMGQIASFLLPYASKMSSLTGIFTSISSLGANTLSSITSSSALASDSEAEYTMCQDYDYNDPDGNGDDDDRIATDPFCNVIYGIPAEELDEDPMDILDEMSGQIDETTGAAIAGSEYEKFLSSCINRTRPIGDQGDGSSIETEYSADGSGCLLNDDNKNYYLYYVDQRVLDSMEGTGTITTPSTTTNETDSSSDTENSYIFFDDIVNNSAEKNQTQNTSQDFSYTPQTHIVNKTPYILYKHESNTV